ncbi:MAG: type II toxin-antitoxin system prevent-host-death family antitoxin, partial [Chromatiaceae bacterium]|nr:type II toxin-antitoxin system prevent-host-death family antitoxin [Chromatiaceae bacterium]
MVYMNLHQAKTALPSLVEAAMQGDEVIIAQDGKPMVRLV